MTLVVALAGAVAIGATLGLLGGGGTVLTVPLVRALLNLDTRHAIALSLPVVAAASATGSLIAWRRGFLSLRPAIELALATSAGAWVGADVAHQLASETQSLLLGLTLVSAAVLIGRRPQTPGSAQAAPAHRHRLWLAVVGAGVGVITGVVGVGGGFLLVPALVAFGGFTTVEAVPVSLFVIACSAATAAVGYHAVPVAWGTAAIMAVAASSGVLAGGTLGRRLEPARLQTLFAVVLLGAAGYLVATLN